MIRFEGVKGLPACQDDGCLVVGLRLFIGHISKTHDETETSRHLNSNTICISAQPFLLSRALIAQDTVQPHLDVPFSMDQSLSNDPKCSMTHPLPLLSPYLIFGDNHAHKAFRVPSPSEQGPSGTSDHALLCICIPSPFIAFSAFCHVCRTLMLTIS